MYCPVVLVMLESACVVALGMLDMLCLLKEFFPADGQLGLDFSPVNCFKAMMNSKIISALRKQNQKAQIHLNAEHKPIVETKGK